MAEQMAPAMLVTLAEKSVPIPMKSDGLLQYCPTMDLLAVATEDEQVCVYRLNGQKVFGTGTTAPSRKADALHWKSNGQLLAIAWSDGVVRIVAADNNKVVNQITVSSAPAEKICCIGWGLNFTDSKASKSRIDASGDVLDDIVGQIIQTNVSSRTLDLPRDLAALDVDGALPRLSVLPSGGKSEDIFSTRSSIDALFSPLRKKEDETVDVLVSGTENGVVHLSIFDCFSLGSFSLSSVSDKLRGCRPLLHSSHPYSSTHALLAVSSADVPVFIPLDLLFVSNSGTYLSLLASKSSQLQNLLRYMSQVQALLQNEWRTSQDLPTKFIRNINETLEERNNCNFMQAAYHLVVTGDCFPAMKEWLVDELTERGHKRWDKAVSTGYENLLRFTHECLLPALERCSVITSRLRGLSKYQKSSLALGLNTTDLNHVLDAVNSLSLLSHNILKHASLEMVQFTAFSKWLRHEIDTQAADPQSLTDEQEERDTLIDHTKVLDYIQGAMTGSRLTAFLRPETPSQKGDKQRNDLAAYAHYETVKRNLGADDSSLPSLASLTSNLQHRCDVVFKQIAEAQWRHVRFGTPIALNLGQNARVLDMRMRSEGDLCYNYIAVALSEAPQDLCIFRVTLEIRKGISSTRSIARVVLRLGSGRVEKARFADDVALLVLWQGDHAYHLLDICYAGKPDNDDGLEYPALNQNTSLDQLSQEPSGYQPTASLDDQETVATYSRHAFSDSGFVPWKLEVNGRKGRRAICVFSSDKTRYKILDMDNAEEGDSQ